MKKFALRLRESTFKAVVRRAKKGKLSINKQIEKELSERRWTDEDARDWGSRLCLLKPDPPYILEDIHRKIEREWEAFKKERL